MDLFHSVPFRRSNVPVMITDRVTRRVKVIVSKCCSWRRNEGTRIGGCRGGVPKYFSGLLLRGLVSKVPLGFSALVCSLLFIGQSCGPSSVHASSRETRYQAGTGASGVALPSRRSRPGGIAGALRPPPPAELRPIPRSVRLSSTAALRHVSPPLSFLFKIVFCCSAFREIP